MRKQNAQLAHFSYLSIQMVADSVLQSSVNFLGLLGELQFTNSHKVFWSRSDERPRLSSSLKDVLPKRYFENQFWLVGCLGFMAYQTL